VLAKFGKTWARSVMRVGAALPRASPLGRRVGSTIVSSTELATMLEHCTQPSCRWSLQHDEPFKVLTTTRRQALQGVPQLAYSTGCRLLKKTTIKTAKARQDICEYCDCWQRTKKVEVQGKLNEWLRAAYATDPTMQPAWEAFVASQSWSESPVFEAAGSPSYINSLHDYIFSWAKKDSDSVSGCAELLHLHTTMATTLFEPGKMVQQVVGFESHFYLRDMQAASYKTDLAMPTQRCLYLHSDFADPRRK
jgi:hypothetical protein